jgi:four helix bundle protein
VADSDPVPASVAATVSVTMTMDDRATASGFDALDKAARAAAIAVSFAMRVPAPLKPIANRLIRSASSVPANLAGCAGRSGRDRLHHWRIAYASAKKVAVHLELRCLSGTVHRGKVVTAWNLVVDVRAMTWRLLTPKPSLSNQTTPLDKAESMPYITDRSANS